MATRAIMAIKMILGLMLVCHPVGAAGFPSAAEPGDLPVSTRDSSDGGALFVQEFPGQPSPPGVTGEQPSDQITPDRRPAWNQRSREEEREPERWQPRRPGEEDRDNDFFRDRERSRLQAPPASVQPRRDGTTGPEPRRQIGPRRFAPTPDLNGRGSPFGIDPRPEDRSDREPWAR